MADDDSALVWPHSLRRHAGPGDLIEGGKATPADPTEKLLQTMADLLVGSVRIMLKEPDEKVAKMVIASLAIEFRQLAESLWDRTHDRPS